MKTVDELSDFDVEGDSIFMAPELLSGANSQKISKAADVFSLGATLLEISVGINLPNGGPMWHSLREGDIQFSPSAQRSPALEDIINRMMEPEPANRPTIDEVLLHPKLQTYLPVEKRGSVSPFSSS